MKKLISAILVISLLAVSAVAFADGAAGSGTPPQMPTGGSASAGQTISGATPTAPRQTGPDGGAPVMIDFDAMVTKGVISQETCDRIKAYMEEHRPDGQPPQMNGEQPSGRPGGQPPQMNGQMPAAPAQGEAPAMGGLLDDLLKDGIITQEEYDALIAAL